MEQTLYSQDNKINNLENYYQDLQNRIRNILLRTSVLELELRNFQQNFLSASLEIAGLSETALEFMGPILETVPSKLEFKVYDILLSRYLPGSKHRPGPRLVEIKTKMAQII